MGSPRERGERVAVAGVYLLTILPVYQSPAVDAADSSRWQSRHLDSNRESNGRGGKGVKNRKRIGSEREGGRDREEMDVKREKKEVAKSEENLLRVFVIRLFPEERINKKKVEI